MKIGVISDTHGSLQAWKNVLEGVFREAEVIIHAGDLLYHGARNPLPLGYDPAALAEEINAWKGILLACRGNCDSPVDQTVLEVPLAHPFLFVQLEGLRIWVHHGHLFPPEKQASQAARWKVGVCISGHSHVPELYREQEQVFLNPGSPSLPKGEGLPTVGLIDVSPARVRVRLWDLDQGRELEEIFL